jgi:hypothetical protein
VPRSLALLFASAATLTLTTPAHAKPCTGATSVQELEDMLPRANVALALAGTEQVAIDPSRRCIGVQVRSRGTARLVKLILRSMDVPREAVELRVVEVRPTDGA